MKNIKFLLFLISVNLSSFAQSHKVDGQMDFNAGLNIHPNWNINSYLEQKNIPKINSLSIYSGISMDLNYQKYFFLSELGFGVSQNTSNNISNRVTNIWGSICFGYNLIQNTNQSVKIGGVFTAYPTRLNIYDNNSSIDINDINLTNTGKTEINLNPFGIGILIRSELFSNSSFPLGITVSYLQNINNAMWSNANGNVQNSIKETNGFYSVKAFIPIKKWKKS